MKIRKNMSYLNETGCVRTNAMKSRLRSFCSRFTLALCVFSVAMAGCSGAVTGKETKTASASTTPEVVFNADSAYHFVARQCGFGPRVPNSEAHVACGDYLSAYLRSCGAQVTEQKAALKAFDGTVLNARNVIAEFYPEKQSRVLLLAHWDCRPWADKDSDPAKRKMPVMGANDGASGTGVLLEIARLLRTNEPNVGIDILLLDAEDWGDDSGDNELSWALGAQYWTAHPHRSGYQRPSYGILLDMVGDANAAFRKEYFSMKAAPGIVEHVWQTAAQLGHSGLFLNEWGGAITDDHVFVNAAGIPCIDIIDQRVDSACGFCPQWHTSDDVMSHISKRPLEAVGQTLVALFFDK